MDRLEEALRAPVTRVMRESAADMADNLARTYRSLGDKAKDYRVRMIWDMAATLASDSAKEVRAKETA